MRTGEVNIFILPRVVPRTGESIIFHPPPPRDAGTGELRLRPGRPSKGEEGEEMESIRPWPDDYTIK